MKPKIIIKIIIDVFMTTGLLFAFGYQFWGDKWHEWIGAGMFVLFILHHVLNAGWYKNLFRGKYSLLRIFTLLVELLLFVDMIALMYSGIVLSRYVFSALPIHGRLALARQLHILGSYWGILLMSLHLGLHWNMILGMIRNMSKKRCDSKYAKMLLFLFGFGIAGYGVSVFIRRNFIDYLFLRTPFVFLDYNENVWLFYIDILALIGTFLFIGHYVSKLIRRIQLEKGKKRTKKLACILMFTLMLGVTACGISGNSDKEDKMQDTIATESITKTETVTGEDEIGKDVNIQEGNPDSTILSAYFTWADNTQVDTPDTIDVDATTSASMLVEISNWWYAVPMAIHTFLEEYDFSGKTVRRSMDGSSGKCAIHVVSAWAVESGIVLGQCRTEEKAMKSQRFQSC